MLDHPIAGATHRQFSARFPWRQIVKAQQTVSRDKRISPTDFAVHLEGSGATRWSAKQFVHPNIRPHRPAWLTGIKDRQRYDDRTRPRGHFIDVDGRPL